MGLLEQAKAKWQGLLDYIDANTPRHAGALPTVGRVVDQGLINPNRFNKPSADRFKESTFGLLGIVPGVGDYASVVESADLFNRGEKFAGGMAALGALPLVPAIGGMFIGKGAKTWDVLKAQQAEELLKQGIDPREVWKQTGTMRGVDGFLRQEIPDNAAAMGHVSPKGSRLVDAIKHKDLEQTYPGIYGAKVFDRNIPALGNYENNPFRGEEISLNIAGGADKSTTLHELQHAIQQREGWARGGSPENSWAVVSDLEDALNSKKETLWAMMRKEIPGDKATQQALRDEIHSMHANYETVASDPMEAYRRLAGEAEARLTQARMNMTMPERLQSYPYDMLDVPQDQLIVRGLLGEDMGPAMHTVYHGSPHKFNKFDMSKIGTGEGAQAYGHGLYFAESPAVATDYATKLSSAGLAKNKLAQYGGDIDAALTAANERIANYKNLIANGGGGDPRRAQGMLNLAEKALNDLLAMKSGTLNEAGNLYKVDIPDEAIPRMLDWDKPLSEQAAIHEQLRPVVEKVYGAGSADYILGRSSATAKTVLDDARRVLGDSGMAESAMKQAGIPGIRYLDGSSRGAGQGTSNFVLFDDQLPRILEVNGQPTGLLSYADEAAQKSSGLLGKVDNAGMSAWKQNDVFGNGKQIEHLSPDGKSAVVQQTLPNGKTVFYPADVDATYGWVRPDMYKRFDSFEAAQKSIKGMRISDAAKKRNTELYGNIPNTWTGDAKKVAKKLIDNGFDVSRFSSSTQSKSKYIELADGRKIRLSDHDLPSYYEGADFDFRYGGDISELIGKLK